MRSLFLKILACFWLSHIAAATLTFVLLTADQARRDAQREEAIRRGEANRRVPTVLPSELLVRHGRHSIALWEQNGGVLGHSLDALQEKTGLDAVLFDAGGREVSGREAPPEAGALRLRAARSNEVEFISSREGVAGARRLVSSRGVAYVFVARKPRSRAPGTTPGTPGLGGRERFQIAQFIAIFVAATVVSYGLALYLTAPTVKLRKATRQLAGGDLSTRVGAQMGRRRDELADLGRDFDLMAERIESLLTAERRLLGDISHELRSPLARLQVALDLAQQGADEETSGFLNRIERESGRLNALIGQLLILTHLESVGAESRREPVSLAPLVEEVASDADFEAHGQNCQVRVTSSDECFTPGNADLLRSAIENVVRNAVRYTREGTTVEVSLKCGKDRNVISVRDHGPGAPQESLPRLFDPFYRVAAARDRQSGGVGLGLSITARAVRFHGGEVSAQNAPDGGLIVEIRLPVAGN